MTGIYILLIGIKTTFLVSICFNFVASFKIRLNGGLLYGRVEVNFEDGSGWGTVCDDSWDVDDARVVCRSLGLPFMLATPVGDAKFGEGTGFTAMDDVSCTGFETSLSHCTYLNRTQENCAHSEDAGVYCPASNLTDYNHLYIANPYSSVKSPLDGMLMLSNNNAEYAVGICSDGFGDNEAKVACSELGYERSSSHVLRYEGYEEWKTFFVWISFECNGTERRLSSCRSTKIYGLCPNARPNNPSVVCNYQPVNAIKLVGNVISQLWILLDYNEVSTLYCETSFARPKSSVRWVLDGKIQTYGVRNSTKVSGSLYRSKSSLTIFANDSLHGKIIKCCSEDPIGYSMCSSNYILNVTVYPTSRTMAINHIYRDSTNKTGDIFQCISQRSRPEPRIDWFHNGIQITNSQMLEAKSQLLEDGTYRKTSTIVFPFTEIFTGSNIVECKVSIENHMNVISVPYFIQRDGGTADIQAINGEKKSYTGNIITYVCFGAVILLLSVAILSMSLIFRRRNLHSGADRTRPAGRDYTPRENEAYTGTQFELENYEQLSPTPGRGLGKIGESVYENTRTS